MSTASPGSSNTFVKKNDDDDHDLTDLQINALISSTLNSPGASNDNSVAGTSVSSLNHDNNNNNNNNDIDMALFNLLSNETMIDEGQQKPRKLSVISGPSVAQNFKKEVKTQPKMVKKEDNIKLEKQEFSSNFDQDDDEDDSSRISLYLRLDFPNFTFYVQTLQVLLGRKIENDDDNSVDVHLGPTKAISRKHGKIFYNFGTQRFELSILGRNGAFVDETFFETGVTLPLKNNSKIQIGEIPFQFVLPTPGTSIKKHTVKKQINPSDAINLKSSLYKNSVTNNNSNKTNSSGSSPAKTNAATTSTTQSPELELDLTKDKKPKEKPPKKVKQPKKVYTLDEIPEQYRTKPSCSYSHLIAVCLKERSTERGMSLSEIYKGIQDLYPYYHYCPDGWQSSVRHNLSLNKSFKKVSKEGKGWLWGLDEEFCAEKEKLSNTHSLLTNTSINNNNPALKKPPMIQHHLPPHLNRPLSQQQQQSLSTLKNNGSPPLSLNAARNPQLSVVKPMSQSPPQGKSIAQLASEIKRPTTSQSPPTQQPLHLNKPNPVTPNNIQAQLAANRSIPKQNISSTIPKSSSISSVPGTNIIRPKSVSPPTSNTPASKVPPPVTNKATTPAPTLLEASTSSTASSPNSKLSGDTMKALNYLQQELIRLTKDRKGLDKKTTTQILTQALAMTISQVNQAAKNSGMTGNPLVLLIDKNPQHLTKILTAALNAATYQVTKGKVKPGMVNNNISSSGSNSGTPSRLQSPPKQTARLTPPPTQQQSYPPQLQPSTKPPINDKFRPPHVTNPMPQQISRPQQQQQVKPISRPPPTGKPQPVFNKLPLVSAPTSTTSSSQQAPVAKPATPKPAAFSKPSAYTPKPAPSSLSPVSKVGLSSPISKPKFSKPSSYAPPPPPSVSSTQPSTVTKPAIPDIKQDLLDTDPLNDAEFDKVLESLSRQGTPGLDDHDVNSEPVDLDKLLAEDGYLNDEELLNDRGVKREFEVESVNENHKVQKTE